jgi:hypothetical protein
MNEKDIMKYDKKYVSLVYGSKKKEYSGFLTVGKYNIFLADETDDSLLLFDAGDIVEITELDIITNIDVSASIRNLYARLADLEEKVKILTKKVHRPEDNRPEDPVEELNKPPENAAQGEPQKQYDVEDLKCPNCKEKIQFLITEIHGGHGWLALNDSNIMSNLELDSIELKCPLCHKIVATNMYWAEAENWLKEHREVK